MRIALNVDFGGMIYPEGCESRQDMIDLFDSLEEISDENLIDDEQETKVVRYKNSLYYTVKLGSTKFHQETKIIDVDTSKLWRIDEYDGAESLVYYKIGENNQLEEIE